MFASRQVAAPRRFAIAADDPSVEPTGTNPTSINATPMLIKMGDQIDVGIDWTQWIMANGGKLLSSAWAKHGSSPANPVVSADAIYVAKNQTVAILNASGATANDVYWLINTVTIEGPTEGPFTMPTRTLKRMLSVKVVA
jgi:hypothetical protein